MKEKAYKIVLISIATLFGISITSAFQLAPGSVNLNSSAPINTGLSNQSKIGALTVNYSGLSDSQGILIPNGQVSFGTLLPNANLKMHVVGKIGADAFCDRQSPNPNCVTIPQSFGSFRSIVLMFESSCPQNWAIVDDMKGRYVRGNNSGSIGQTGGVDSPHRHTLGINRTGPDFRGGSNQVQTEIDPAITSYISTIPPYLNVVFCKYVGP